jgi:hypothetical protein
VLAPRRRWEINATGPIPAKDIGPVFVNSERKSFAMTEASRIRFRVIKQSLALAALLALAACQNGEPLAEAKGPWRQLNVGYWSASPADLNPQIQIMPQ